MSIDQSQLNTRTKQRRRPKDAGRFSHLLGGLGQRDVSLRPKLHRDAVLALFLCGLCAWVCGFWGNGEGCRSGAINRGRRRRRHVPCTNTKKNLFKTSHVRIRIQAGAYLPDPRELQAAPHLFLGDLVLGVGAQRREGRDVSVEVGDVAVVFGVFGCFWLGREREVWFDRAFIARVRGGRGEPGTQTYTQTHTHTHTHKEINPPHINTHTLVSIYPRTHPRTYPSTLALTSAMS